MQKREVGMNWIYRISVLFLSILVTQISLASHLEFAPAPPLGWNSWDHFGTTITEDQAKRQADAMAKTLRNAGYEYFVVDIQWYEPNSEGHVYKEGALLQMDENSRLLPAINKFPSSKNGQGFKPLADYVHSKNLKFGIHIMRGISRQAVKMNTAILGTKLKAADIANINSTCMWNPDMYGVDMNKPGAQAYYDSLFQLYASWGVDFIKVDDIARPYDETQKAEIEAIRKAIDKTGRNIVLSLSPGDTPITRAEHVVQHANMWRISNDFWDRWPPVYGMFERLEKWTKYRTKGAWPDADMLPFGIVEFNRPTHFTKDEQRVVMTLWSIARSPLIFGGDMTRMDDFTKSLLTNSEILAVNQSSENNRQFSRNKDLIVWTADVPNSKDKYVAFFNAQSNDDPFDLTKPTFRSRSIHGEPGAEVVDIEVPIKNAKRLVLSVGDGGDGPFNDHAGWINPEISGEKGSLSLTDLQWKFAISGWGDVRKNETVDEHPLIFKGEKVKGIGAHAVSVVEYEIPEGYSVFKAKGILTAGSQGKGGLDFMVLVDPPKNIHPETSQVSVDLSLLGFKGDVRVRDLWTKEDLGLFKKTFSRDLKIKNAGLYRISPISE